MTRLILHIGPGKCGSTTIQRLCAASKGAFNQSVGFHFLDPTEFVDLDTGTVSSSRISALDDLIKKTLNDHNVAVISHEFLFQTPQAVGIIIQRMMAACSDVRLIGYARRQSSLLTSTYSQWLFRARERLDEISLLLRHKRIEPKLFTGLERQFIASIIDDFHSARQLSGYNLLDLWGGYKALERQAQCTDFRIGVLPTAAYSFSLVNDFCKKADLELSVTQTLEEIVNPKFNSGLVASLNAAVLAGEAELHPHQGNDEILALSQKLPDFAQPRPEFLDLLCAYTDAYFSDGNKALVERYELFDSYFSVKTSLSKDELLDAINEEQRYRMHNPNLISEYYAQISQAIKVAQQPN